MSKSRARQSRAEYITARKKEGGYHAWQGKAGKGRERRTRELDRDLNPKRMLLLS